MAELKELIAKRGRVKTQITFFDKLLTSLIDSKLTKIQCNELNLRLSKFQDLFNYFEEIQCKIESLDKDEDIQMQEREETENRFFSLLARAQELIQLFEDSLKNESASISDPGHPKYNHLKLAPLKITPFSGCPSKWLEFRDTYLSLIHNNHTIDNINKFHYLKTYLEDSASSVIHGVSVSADNYSIAWSLLCDRFDNKRLLINEHIKGLFSIEPISKESNRCLRDLIDTISKNLNALNSLGEPTNYWDTLVIYMAGTKLDSATARKWEEFRSTLDSVKLSDFFNFLRQRAIVLETIEVSKNIKSDKRNSFVKSRSFTVSSPSSPTSYNHYNHCQACKQYHKLYECPKFKSLPVEERISKVFEWRLCTNCLREGHRSTQCRLGGCRVCRRKHNSILHKQSSLHYTPSQLPTPSQPSTSSTTSPTRVGTTTSPPTSNAIVPRNNSVSSKPSVKDPSSIVNMSAVSPNQALLSTVLVEIIHNNKSIKLKALLDSGSQSSFLTEAARSKIGLPKIKEHIHCVLGLNNSMIKITEHCNVTIHSTYNSFCMPVKCYIIPLITDKLPQVNINVASLKIPGHIQLADPTFYCSSEIDMLLGADVFWDLLCSSKFKLGLHQPTLQETQLGWIVAGPMGGKYGDTSNKMYCHFSKEIQQQLSKFWELEEVPTDNPSFDEHYCETLFNDTTYRDENGRFYVQIPLRDLPDVLGESYQIAKKRLFQTEKKLNRNPTLRADYNKFMHEYEQLGHMCEVNNCHGCYLPHNVVIRESSETSKTRVVFDASSKTSNDISFNDIQLVGPVVQDDLFSILLRFRQHKYVVTADIEKMYRQILIQPEQRHLQMILWRESDRLPIKTYQLKTVTYGTASAPFLSTRCLLQLSKECKDKKISKLIKHDFYVDDLITGSQSEPELVYIINEVTAILKSACFPLRKFRTNQPSIFKNNSSIHIDTDLDLSSQSSALGLKWDPIADVLKFPTKIDNTSLPTKRFILSNSAKLFDPLGLLSACTIIPKIILQKLWLLKLDWDDPIPSEIANSWANFASNLKYLSTLQIPRNTLSTQPEIIELHAFCDASLDAYASCIYLRSIDKSRQITVNLLCAKTRVSPLKSQTIPKLELCGALLASRLASSVLKALRLPISETYYWTDSSVVLGWLSSHSRDLKTFVANRVAMIQERTSSSTWRHVPGTLNPADLASRGLNPKHIQNATLWWQGPPFLSQDKSEWPTDIQVTNELPERKVNFSDHSSLQTKYTLKSTFTTTITNSVTTHANQIINIDRFSNFLRLHRCLAYVLRFIHNARHRNSKYIGPLTTDELKISLNYLIKQHQLESFNFDLNLLNNKKCLPARSRLLSLHPFIDEDGILRVGGRIQNSLENYEKKHPILLDSNHPLTKLLFAQEHKRLMHGGPLLLLNHIRQTYWPIAGRRLARSTVNNCKLCRIMKATTINPIMGNLPTSRVTPNLPFQISGVDFAGPFLIRDRLGRGCKLIKSYLCLFICMSTRAVHLELASDLSTDIFLLCLRKFISRRGKPSEIHCDNGRNFVGANNDLRKFLQSVENNVSITSFAVNEGIQFKFSPAYSPHFGGLWEAGIKAAKHHLFRMMGSHHYTYEELSTLLVQIEAILNSRPLTPLSSDPIDLLPLTPSHFLIGRPLTSLPSPALLDFNTNHLNRYQRIEQLKQQFWERWRHEYLCELQQRTKWYTNQGKLLCGDMVVIKEANLPPLKWCMGRITKLYPGADGVARVADVFTTKGTVRRAIRNLCPLIPQHSKVVEGGEDVRA